MLSGHESNYTVKRSYGDDTIAWYLIQIRQQYFVVKYGRV